MNKSLYKKAERIFKNLKDINLKIEKGSFEEILVYKEIVKQHKVTFPNEFDYLDTVHGVNYLDISIHGVYIRITQTTFLHFFHNYSINFLQTNYVIKRNTTTKMLDTFLTIMLKETESIIEKIEDNIKNMDNILYEQRKQFFDKVEKISKEAKNEC